MTTVLRPPTTTERVASNAEARVFLRNISWETYERLLEDLSDSSVPHLTYDRGDLEIMSPTAKHEEINRAIELMVNLLAFELNIELRGLGSTTFKRHDIKRGFEPDSCFYFKNEARIRGKERIDLSVDPPPDVAVEIDITSPSIHRLPIFAEFGVPEVWRYKGDRMLIFLLEQGTYVQSEASVALPLITSEILTVFVNESLSLGRIEWMTRVRDWAGQVKVSK